MCDCLVRNNLFYTYFNIVMKLTVPLNFSVGPAFCTHDEEFRARFLPVNSNEICRK